MRSSPHDLLSSTNFLYILKRKATITQTDPQVLIMESTLSANLKETAVSFLFSYLYIFAPEQR